MVDRRAWTPESIQEWWDARDARLESKGLSPFAEMTLKEKEDNLRVEKENVIETERSNLKAQSWDIGKHPILSYSAPFSGLILLPKNYHATSGTDKIRICMGEDINRVVFKHYDERVNPQTYPGDNYVSKDGLCPKRHEYLGPSPRVASYRFTGTIVEIEWWESYIKDTWIGTKSWKVEAEFDETVEGWFLIDRNNF